MLFLVLLVAVLSATYIVNEYSRGTYSKTARAWRHERVERIFKSFEGIPYDSSDEDSIDYIGLLLALRATAEYIGNYREVKNEVELPNGEAYRSAQWGVDEVLRYHAKKAAEDDFRSLQSDANDLGFVVLPNPSDYLE